MEDRVRVTAIAVVLLIGSASARTETIDSVWLTPSPPIKSVSFTTSVNAELMSDQVTQDIPFHLYSRTGNDLTSELRFLESAVTSPNIKPCSTSYVVDPLAAGEYALNVSTQLNGMSRAFAGVRFPCEAQTGAPPSNSFARA